MKQPLCTYCGGSHYQTWCLRKPKKRIVATKPLPCPTKPIARIGKVGKATNAAVAKWKLTQKPTHQGYYQCYICGTLVPYLMAEHVKSKVRSPGSRTDPSNLKPVCAPCNASKGSQSFVV